MDKNKTEEVELLTPLNNFVPDTQRTFDFDSLIANKNKQIKFPASNNTRSKSNGNAAKQRKGSRRRKNKGCC